MMFRDLSADRILQKNLGILNSLATYLRPTKSSGKLGGKEAPGCVSVGASLALQAPSEIKAHI